MIRFNIIYFNMIEEIYNYFTVEMLYYWINFGVLPFWAILIFFPHSNLSRYFVTSIFPIFILGGAYIFILYKSYLNSYNFENNFTLYLGINSLLELFTNKSYLIMFWIHFISINLFTGGWIVKDSSKFSINKFLVAIPLLITYLIGPIGLFVYWIIRIFYAKSINLYD
tara:strand:- start:1856 stop:2359 length:504 start_codon:yes stop_codon:yes gene_type:complete